MKHHAKNVEVVQPDLFHQRLSDFTEKDSTGAPTKTLETLPNSVQVVIKKEFSGMGNDVKKVYSATTPYAIYTTSNFIDLCLYLAEFFNEQTTDTSK